MGDVYGPLNSGNSKQCADLNSNPTSFSPRVSHPPAPEGVVKFEDDDKESSSDGMNSSQENLTHIWSDDDDSDRMILRRQSMIRRPVRTRKGNSMLSTRSMSIVSSEEGEASEYPSSQRSTIESNLEIRPTFIPKDFKSSTPGFQVSSETNRQLNERVMEEIL